MSVDASLSGPRKPVVRRLRFRVWSRRTALCFVTGGVLYALTPQVGFLHDGQRYAEMATDPFHNHVGSPWSLRIAVPLLVHVLPFSQAHCFYGLAMLSVVVSGLLVAATTAELGLPERHACAAAVLTCASELTVISFWAYYVDIELLVIYAAVVHLAVRRRSWAMLPLVAGGTLVKEIAVLGAPLAALIWGRHRRSTAIAAVSAIAALAVFAVEAKLLPTKGARSGISSVPTTGNVLHTQWNYTTYWLGVVWRFGVLRYGANAVLSVFGVAWLAWPAGFRGAPAWLRRALLWAVVAMPFFITAQWERSFALLLPLAVPLAMLGLRSWPLLELAAFTLGSAWVSGVAPSQTIGDDAVTSAATKLGWMSPGFALATAAVGSVIVRRRLKHRPATARRTLR